MIKLVNQKWSHNLESRIPFFSHLSASQPAAAGFGRRGRPQRMVLNRVAPWKRLVKLYLLRIEREPTITPVSPLTQSQVFGSKVGMSSPSVL